ncbi:MAG: RHS repeat domain-containing protein [Ruminiclostridium sp.]
MLAAITATGVDTFSYTPNDQLSAKSRNGKEVLKYSYDKNGNVLSVKDQTGQATGYTYDINNNLKTVLDGNDIIATYSYNVDQTVSDINYKNGIDISYVYDKDKNVSSLLQKDPKGEEINSFAYTYDNNGNQLSKNENGSAITYTYDKLNRLISSGTDSFTYDKAGNRKTWGKANESITYSYDNNNRLTEATSSKSGSIVNSYDRNENQLTSSDGTAYTYDGFNQLMAVTLPDSNWMENEYDAFGLRVSVFENGMSSNFTYDRGRIITEVNCSDKLVSRNIRGLELVARENSVGTLAYYLNNAHGDVSKLVNENGDVLNSYEYDAFGNTTNYTEKVQNRFQYAGEQFDKVTGQYYLRARYYDPTTGRFATEDTYRGQLNDTMSLNLYSYCGNNPVNFVDPSGHMSAEKLNAYSYIYNTARNTDSYNQYIIEDNGLNIYTALHEIAQLNVARELYIEYGAEATLEYKIKSKTEKNIFGKCKTYEADVVFGRAVWEVKPKGTSATAQLKKYTENGDLTPGNMLNTVKDILIVDSIYEDKKIYMKVEFPNLGEAKYSFYKKKDKDGKEEEELVKSTEVFNKLFQKNKPPMLYPIPMPIPIPIPI